jgi:hypothetical protein
VLPDRLDIVLNPAWPAPRIAAAILDATRRTYADTLDITGIQREMQEIWVDLQQIFKAEERQRIGDIAHVCVPMNDLSACINLPPSRKGYFVLFDAVLDLRMWEIFTAPRDEVAWAAAYVNAAWGHSFIAPYWVGPAVDRLTSLGSGDMVPDSYSLSTARDFVFAHECGHFFLGHLDRGLERRLHFGGQDMATFDPRLEEEIAADRFAREVLCRNDRSLVLQQMGVDWLFGFLGAVLAMRECVEAVRSGLPEPPLMHPGITRRRAEAWTDYERRRSESADARARSPEVTRSLNNVRTSVENFNSVMPAALAGIYAAVPDELLDWQQRVCRTPMSDEHVKIYREELSRLGEKTLAQGPRRANWGWRLWHRIQNMF